MFPFIRLGLAALAAWTFLAAAHAQNVLVCWGDSILAGYNSSGGTYTPFGPAPFGDPLPDAYRWDAATQSWGPLTPFQNQFGTGADPVYGFAAGWRRFHGGEIYVIALAVPGSDVSASHPNPLGSWHPSVVGGAFERLATDHLAPALATLPTPDIRAVLFNAGNNNPTPNLIADIDSVNAAISAYLPWSTPRFLGVKTYLGTPQDMQTMVQRHSIEAWAAASTRRHAVETITLPARTGGLYDGYHLSHFGSIFLGFWAAVTEFYEL